MKIEIGKKYLFQNENNPDDPCHNKNVTIQEEMFPDVWLVFLDNGSKGIVYTKELSELDS